MKRRLISAFRAAVALSAAVLLCVGMVRHFHIRHFREVRREVLYRSGQPEGLDWARLNYRYHIHTVVSLRSIHERSEGNWYDQEHQAADKYDLHLVEMPMRGPVPTAEQADRWLATMREPANWPVLIHCERGKDRAGTLVALYRMYVQNWPLEQAMDELIAVKGKQPDREVHAFLRSYRPPSAVARRESTQGSRDRTDSFGPGGTSR